MPGGIRELTNPADFPRITAFSSDIIMPAINGSGQPVGVPTTVFASVTDVTDVEAAMAALTVSIHGDMDALTTLLSGQMTSLSATLNARMTTVEGLAASGVLWHTPLDTAAVSNGTLATAFANGQVVGGITLTTGMRIGLFGQTTASQNGAYTVNASGAPTRATDSDSSAELVSAGYLVMGGTNAGQWVQNVPGPITVGTTALNFIRIGAAVAANLTVLPGSIQIFDNLATSNVPRGILPNSVANGGSLSAITAGSGGTNGTFALSWTGGNFQINPTGTFTVINNAVSAVNITGPGRYVGAAATAPTAVFSASAGLTGASVSLTPQFLLPEGGDYFALSVDGTSYDHYKNVAGVATLDATIPSFAVTSSVTTLGKVLPYVKIPTDLFADFVNSRYLSSGKAALTSADFVTLNAATFTRAGNAGYWNSSGYFVAAAANAPRVSIDPVRGKTFLFEGAATNIIANSHDIASSSWAFSASADVTRTSNTGVGIDGATTGGRIREVATTATHQWWYYNGLSTLVSGTVYTYQFIWRPEGRTKLRFGFSPTNFGMGSDVTFDTATMIIGGTSSAGWTLEAFPNGAYRVWKSFTAATNNVFSVLMNMMDSTGATTYLGDISLGMTLLGAQLEVGSKPTSYIANASNSVGASRSADALTLNIPASVSKLSFILGSNATQVVTVTPGGTYALSGLTENHIKTIIGADVSTTGSPVTTVAGRIGDVVLSQSDITGLKTTDSPTFNQATFNGPTLNGNATGSFPYRISVGTGQTYVWARSSLTALTGRYIIIGGGNIVNTVSPASQNNAVVIGTDAGGSATTVQTSVIIGDTAGGGSSISGCVCVGNEGGNNSGGTMSGCNIIGNVTCKGGGTYSRTDVYGQAAMTYNNATDVVAIGNASAQGVTAQTRTLTQSVFIGSQTGKTLAGAGTSTNIVLIGYNVQTPTATTSNYFSIADFFKGDLSTGAYTMQLQNGSAAVLSVGSVASTKAVPTTSSDTGTLGEVRTDDNYIYRCTATNTWKRTPVAFVTF